MKQKLQNYQHYIVERLLLLRDVRVIGLMLFLLVMLLMSWSGVKTIDTNYGLQKQISQLEQQNQVQALANANLNLQNQYFNTNQYLELAARQNFGLAAPGETELIVPASVALAHTVSLPADVLPQAKAVAKLPFYQRNFQAWMDFFLHRQDRQ